MSRFLVIFLLLASCNTPGPEFAGIDATQVTVQGSVFHVRVNGRKAEAIRVNSQYAPRVGPIGARAAFAMQQVSGCTVTKLKGDAAVLIGTLRCSGDRSHGEKREKSRGDLVCREVETYGSAVTGKIVTSYDCDWVPEAG